MSDKRKKVLGYLIILLMIPIAIYMGIIAIGERRYNLISIVVVILACVPNFILYERKKTGTRELVVIAVMTAISVIGRIAFTAIPGFKPVTAIVVLTGMYLGAEAGFLTGALSAIVSNMFFGQGPWTPFQMFSWGLLGFIAGLPFMQKILQKKLPLVLYGIISGVFYSLLMDVWTAMAIDGVFNLSRYLVLIVRAVPFMIAYAASNVIFLLIAKKFIGEKLERIKEKIQVN